MLVFGKINDVNARLLIDTGASSSCINYLSSKKYSLNYIKFDEKILSANSEINETFYSKNNKFEIGDFKKNDFEILLFDMSYINNALKEKEIDSVDGIIGSDILKELNAKIDYEKKLLLLKL